MGKGPHLQAQGREREGGAPAAHAQPWLQCGAASSINPVPLPGCGHGHPPQGKPGKPGTRCAKGAGSAFWWEGAGSAPPHHTFVVQGCPRAEGAMQALGKV